MKKKETGQSSNKKSQKEARKSGFLGLFLRSFLLAIVLTTFVGILVFYVKYGKQILEMQRIAKEYVWNSTEDTFRQSQTSLFFDSKGELISSLSGEKELYYVRYEDIPSNVIDAIVTIEDKRFFEHDGVDLIANVRAAIALIKNEGKITQGASTITQQLARNIFLTNEVSYERKVTEIFIASELEKKYSKQQILEYYLNNIYFANGYYGIQAAAKGYFNKSVSELTLSEAAFLCAIPNGPSYYDPVHHKRNTMKRRNKILQQMYEDGVITSKQYKKAKAKKNKIKKSTSTSRSSVESYIYQNTIETLMEQDGFVFATEFETAEAKEEYQKNYQERYQFFQSKLYTGGYRVYTSIDLEKQNLLQKTLDEVLAEYGSVNSDGIYELQGSAVCIDNQTGKVIAVVGGRSQEFKSLTLNRAYQSYRQPGSAIKPLLVYLPYFMRGHNPEEVVTDEPIEDGPKNSNGTFLGDITLRTAVEQSTNTIAWKLFDLITPKVGLSYLKSMGFKKIVPDDEVLPASLGGFTYGTNTLEMAAAYATIVNDGIYRKPTCIVTITDAFGEVIAEGVTTEKAVYATEESRIMTDVLRGVMTKGTGKNLAISGVNTAGKTGTTSDKKDGWFCGYSTYYTTCVWVGYDYPKTMSNLYGNTFPGYIWRDFMSEVHQGKDITEFKPFVDTWSVEEEQEEEESEEEQEQEEEEELQESSEDEQPEKEKENPEDEKPTEKPEESEPTKVPKPTQEMTPIPTEPPKEEEEEQPEEPTPEVTQPEEPAEEDEEFEEDDPDDEEFGDDWEDEWDVEEDFDANDSEEESEGFDYYYSDGKPYYLPSQP